jgi:O-antigen/teichoic acid export membrane protein
VAPDFVPVVLGDHWSGAVPVVQILAWVGIVQALQSLNVDILMARDRTRTIFAFSIVLCATHLVSFSIGVQWGIIGVAVAYAIATTLVETMLTVLAARSLGVSPMVFVRAINGVFQATIGMCAVMEGIRMALLDTGVPTAGRLLLCVAAGGLVYIALCAWRVPEVTAEVRSLLNRRGGGGGLVPSAAAAES